MRLADHPLSRDWIAQFDAGRDRSSAARFLDSLHLVSSTAFESHIERSLVNLQRDIGERIAVFPVAPPTPAGILGYNLFAGGIADPAAQKQGREVGRRRKFGSEDRVGHFLSKLQSRLAPRENGPSLIECQPTLNQVRTQGIRHLVLLDDISGSGKRLTDFWSEFPRTYKSLLSYKKVHLWVVLYAITDSALRQIQRKLPNLPLENVRTVTPATNLNMGLDLDLVALLNKYSTRANLQGAALGYRGSAAGVVFEHGCPNNAPALLWRFGAGNWRPLFPNRGVPADLRSCFVATTNLRSPEVLWKVGQAKVALTILEAAERNLLSADHRLMITVLALIRSGVAHANIVKRLMLRSGELELVRRKATELLLLNSDDDRLTELGGDLLDRLREMHHAGSDPLWRTPESYYPQQCGGKLQRLA